MYGGPGLCKDPYTIQALFLVSLNPKPCTLNMRSESLGSGLGKPLESFGLSYEALMRFFLHEGPPYEL